jgi:hypothetical protein
MKSQLTIDQHQQLRDYIRGRWLARLELSCGIFMQWISCENDI